MPSVTTNARSSILSDVFADAIPEHAHDYDDDPFVIHSQVGHCDLPPLEIGQVVPSSIQPLATKSKQTFPLSYRPPRRSSSLVPTSIPSYYQATARHSLFTINTNRPLSPTTPRGHHCNVVPIDNFALPPPVVDRSDSFELTPTNMAGRISDASSVDRNHHIVRFKEEEGVARSSEDDRDDGEEEGDRSITFLGSGIDLNASMTSVGEKSSASPESVRSTKRFFPPERSSDVGSGYSGGRDRRSRDSGMSERRGGEEGKGGWDESRTKRLMREKKWWIVALLVLVGLALIGAGVGIGLVSKRQNDQARASANAAKPISPAPSSSAPPIIPALFTAPTVSSTPTSIATASLSPGSSLSFPSIPFDSSLSITLLSIESALAAATLTLAPSASSTAAAAAADSPSLIHITISSKPHLVVLPYSIPPTVTTREDGKLVSEGKLTLDGLVTKVKLFVPVPPLPSPT